MIGNLTHGNYTPQLEVNVSFNNFKAKTCCGVFRDSTNAIFTFPKDF
jgi:hypothetical protein